MKTKPKKELIQKSSIELNNLLTQEKEQLFKLKLDLTMKKIKNVHSVLAKRKDIAFIQTLISEKKLLEAVK